MGQTYSPYGIVDVSAPAEHRGDDEVQPRKFKFQSASLTWAWGSEPATATLVYVGRTPVTIGAQLKLAIAGHTFYGLCKSDTPFQSSKGSKRTLEFEDNRTYLDWDRVYAAFNIPDDRIVEGVRLKRYRHVLPLDYETLTWSYTLRPYSARRILDFLFSSPTIADAWRRIYHPAQRAPVFNLDFLSGESLKSAVQKVTDALGLTFTLMGGPFRLVWARKGEGPTPLFPVLSDDRENGLALSGNPTRIRILGDRNLYQVHDIPMVQDWARAWERFFDPILFYEEVFQKGQTRAELTLKGVKFPAGTPFVAISAAMTTGPNPAPVDPEQMVSRQLAKAAALEMTVQQYAELVDDESFLDYRKFAGRSRLDMPAVLYLKQVLFRAFRFSEDFGIVNQAGQFIPLPSLEIASKMVAKVTHDPVTGEMDWDATENADGNGYGIVQGYQVGKDLFKTIKPERFRPDQWTDAQKVWEHVEFHVDDSGDEDGRFILFDEPVIKSADLVDLVDGYAVFKAKPTFSVPEVRAALTFQAERFSFLEGRSWRDEVENVPGLCGEFATSFASSIPPEEIPYADGRTAMQKADEIATALLPRQFVYAKGSYTRWVVPDANGNYPPGTQLTGKIDRVELSLSPSGCSERVELTAELPRQFYVPERDLERATKLQKLLPGQAELRHEANLAKLTAAALRASPTTSKTTADAFHGLLGSDEPLEPIFVAPSGNAATLPVGAPFWRRPVTVINNVPTNTVATLPANAGNEHSEFVGVTVRSGEAVASTGGELMVQRTGDLLARVKGPVKVGDVVGKVDNADYLAPGKSNTVGKALQEIAGSDIKLIRVRTTSASAPSTGFPFQIVKGTSGDNTAKVVANSYLLKGLDAKDKSRIFGLNREFILTKTDLVYLEMLFDKSGKIFLANICKGQWDTEVFPRNTRAVRKTVDNARITESAANWVIGNTDPKWTTNKTLAEDKFNQFDDKRRHWNSFIVIGFCTEGKGADGLQMSDATGSWTVVQCLKTHLMLAGFCENGVPVSFPIASNAPVLDKLPNVVATMLTYGTQLEVPDHPEAVIHYTLDGSTPNENSPVYTGVIGGQPNGTTIKTYVREDGYYDSDVVTYQGWL